MFDASYVWTIIILLGVGTWMIRFSFMGLVGDRPWPAYFRRMLNYSAVAVLPGICAPIILTNKTSDFEPLRLMAAAAILIIGVWTQSLMKSISAGLLIYFGINALL